MSAFGDMALRNLVLGNRDYRCLEVGYLRGSVDHHANNLGSLGVLFTFSSEFRGKCMETSRNIECTKVTARLGIVVDNLI